MLLAKVVGVKALGLAVGPQDNSCRASQRAQISVLQLLQNFPLFSSCVLLFLCLFILTGSPPHWDLVSKTACKTPIGTVLLGG